MYARPASVRKCAFSVLTINQPAVLEVTQRQPNCDTTDIETAAELVLAGDGKRGCIIAAEYFLCYCGDKA